MRKEQEIIEWATDKNIIGLEGKATRLSQFRKTAEEVNELLEAIDLKDVDLARDAIGDIYVTIVLQARLWGLTMTECVDAAYDEIKDRKGVMIDGVFVKDQS